MTYLQALRMMVKAYKAARGVMPKGLDLLKLKMKARQKAIDSKKVIEFPKERITNPFKPRPRSESEAQMLARMKRQNKEAAQRLRDKKEKDLGDKLKDLPDDIPDMADGGVASAIKNIKKRDGYIIGGLIGNKIRRNVTPEPLEPKLQNLINVYESNPTLQSSMSIDDYLMQAYRPTTPTTEELATGIATQATQPAAVKPIKPIIPIPESGDGGGMTIGRGRTASNQPNYMGGKEPGIVAALQRTVGEIKDSPIVKYNPLNPMFIFNVGKAGLEKARDFAKQVQAQKAEEERIRQEQIAAAAELARRGTGAYITQDSFGGDYGQRAGGGSFSGRGASTDITAETGSS